MTAQTQTRVLSFGDGESYHLYASAAIAITNNCVRWQIVIGVNGYVWADDTRLAGRGAWQDHRRIATVEDALRYGLMLAEIYVQSLRRKREVRNPETAAQRMTAICDTLRRDNVLQKQVHCVYPSAWREYVYIEVRAVHEAAIRSVVDRIMDGHNDVEVEYKVIGERNYVATT